MQTLAALHPAEPRPHLLRSDLASRFVPGTPFDRPVGYDPNPGSSAPQATAFSHVGRYGPIIVEGSDGHPVLFTYFAEGNSVAGGHPYDPAKVFPSTVEGDQYPGRIYEVGNDQYQLIRTKPLPIFGSQANFIEIGPYLLTSESTLKQNQMTPEEHARQEGALGTLSSSALLANYRNTLTSLGYKPRNPDETREVIEKETGKKLLVLPWLPGDAVGDLRHYIGKLDDGTLVIPYIDPEAIKTLPQSERDYSNAINAFLDHQRDELVRQGFAVERTPISTPRDYVSGHGPYGKDALLPSLVDWQPLGGGKVLVPQYVGPRAEAAEAELRALLAKHHLEPVFVPAETLLHKQKVGLSALYLQIPAP